VGFLITLINLIAQAITLLVIAQIILSYLMSPFHPVRKFIDDLVEPMLAPLRRVVPPVGMFDFTPMVLIIIVQLVARLLVGILITI
jgi:YggT family protein